MKIPRPFLAVIALLLSANIFAQDNYRVSDIPEELTENANSVVVDHSVNISIPDNRTIISTTRRVITVLNKAGGRHVDSYVYYDDETRVKSVKAVILDAYGLELETFRKRDFEDLSAVSGGTLYSDSRVLVMDYTPTTYPYTVIFEYETESDNTFFIPRWMMYQNTYSSVWKKSININYAPSLGLRHKVFDPSGQFVVEEAEGSLTVNVTNALPIRTEEMGPGFSDLVPTVHFGLSSFSIDGMAGQASNWEELGAWQYRNLVSGLDALPADVVQEVTALVADAPNDKEKVKRIYNYMQDNTRYISVQLGIGGLRPYPADEVIEVGYGDCKGLTNLTKALLKTQGIEAQYCVVWAGRNQRSIDKDFASLQGNHVILNVPLEDEELWLECTSQTMPFNFLGDFTDDRDVVALTENGGIIKHTPVYATEQNTLVTTGEFTLKEDGYINGTVNLESHGIQYDNRSALLYEDQKDRISSYKNYWRYVDNLQIDSIELIEDKDAVSLKEEVSITARDYASFTGEKMIIPVNVMDRFTYVPRRYKERTQEAWLLRGGIDKTEFIINIPEGMQVDSTPAPISFESEYGSYSLEVTEVAEGQIKVTRTFLHNSFKAQKEEYKDVRNFLRSVARSDAAKMVLVKKT